MAGWQDLLGLLLDEAVPAHEIPARLGVQPWRMAAMLGSRRLRRRLDLLGVLAHLKGHEALVRAAGQAGERMAALTGALPPDAARRACVDVLEATAEDRTMAADALRRVRLEMEAGYRRRRAAGRPPRTRGGFTTETPQPPLASAGGMAGVVSRHAAESAPDHLAAPNLGENAPLGPRSARPAATSAKPTRV